MSEEPRDAYARRQKRKQREGQGCAILLIAGLGGLAAGVLGIVEAVSKLV